MDHPWEGDQPEPWKADDTEGMTDEEKEIVAQLGFLRELPEGDDEADDTKRNEVVRELLSRLLPGVQLPEVGTLVARPWLSGPVEKWHEMTQEERIKAFGDYTQDEDAASIEKEIGIVSSHLRGSPFGMPFHPFNHAQMAEWFALRNGGTDMSFLLARLVPDNVATLGVTMREVMGRLDSIWRRPNLSKKAKMVIGMSRMMLDLIMSRQDRLMDAMAIMIAAHNMNYLLGDREMTMCYHNHQRVPMEKVHGVDEYYPKLAAHVGVSITREQTPYVVNFLPSNIEENEQESTTRLETLAHVTQQGYLEDMSGGKLGSWCAMVTSTHWIFRNPLALLYGFHHETTHEEFERVQRLVTKGDTEEADGLSTKEALRISLRGTVPLKGDATEEFNRKLLDDVWLKVVNAMLRPEHRALSIEGSECVLRATDGNKPILARCGAESPFLVVPTSLDVI